MSEEPLQSIWIRKIKRPSGSRLWPSYAIDEDEHGYWYFTPSGSWYRGEDGSTVAWCEVSEGEDNRGRHTLFLIPHDARWVSSWVLDEGEIEVNIDVCTPAQRTNWGWQYEDLELDPFRRKDSGVGVEDWDEFTKACELGQISTTEEVQARLATEEVCKLLEHHQAPFNVLAEAKLDAAIELGLVSILTLRIYLCSIGATTSTCFISRSFLQQRMLRCSGTPARRRPPVQ